MLFVLALNILPLIFITIDTLLMALFLLSFNVIEYFLVLTDLLKVFAFAVNLRAALVTVTLTDLVDLTYLLLPAKVPPLCAAEWRSLHLSQERQMRPSALHPDAVSDNPQESPY